MLKIEMESALYSITMLTDDLEGIRKCPFVFLPDVSWVGRILSTD